MSDDRLKKQKSFIDKKQLMLNFRKLRLQRKAVAQKADTDMQMQTQSFKIKPFGQFITEGGLARAIEKSKSKVTGHISADRGSDEGKNREKRKGLEKDLKKKGIGIRRVWDSTSMTMVKLAQRFPITPQNLIKCRSVVSENFPDDSVENTDKSL